MCEIVNLRLNVYHHAYRTTATLSGAGQRFTLPDFPAGRTAEQICAFIFDKLDLYPYTTPSA